MVATSRQWLAAYGLIVALGLAELYVAAPTIVHLAHVASRATGSVTTEALHVAVVRDFVAESVWTIVGPFVLWGFVAALLSLCAMAMQAPLTTFAAYFALCVNCALPAEIGQFFISAATRLHDPASFRNATDVWTVLPFSLALLRAHGSLAEIAFLSYWNPFTLWSLALLGYGYATLAKINLVPALLLAFGVGLALALAQVSLT